MSFKRNLLLVVVLAIIIYILGKGLVSSLFFKKIDKVNIVFYGPKAFLYSIGDDTNYLLPFSPQIELLVPGGYGYYKAGALGKLISLEKKPSLFQKTFSANTCAFVDLYFFPKKTEIYYEDQGEDRWPSFAEIFFSNSNANFFDRIFTFLTFSQRRSSQFREVEPALSKTGQRSFWDGGEFFKSSQGFFYKKTYREEKRTVQIIYTKSYKTALLLNRIVEGEGIRVVDLTYSPKPSPRCQIVEKAEKGFSESAKGLASFFNCQLIKGQTETSDIIFILGSLEENWLFE